MSHKRVTHHLNLGGQTTYSRYVCAVDYESDRGMTLHTLPAGTVGVRGALLMPEAPLVFGQPRPNSSQNTFCLSCHTPERPDVLSDKALIFDAASNLEEDIRRQPMQAPRFIFGHIPEGYVGGALPEDDEVAEQIGAYLDQWVHAP